MASRWLSIEVELLGGRGQDLWPPPGRRFAVGPSHTFADLAGAIDAAFARWELGHRRNFTLADGRMISDSENLEELRVGDEFRYVFGAGDGWTHRCVVSGEIDPTEILGAVPRRPLAYFGWGTIPDQCGRRWSDDTGEEPVPPRPARPHPMLTREWPDACPKRSVDLSELHRGVARGDADAIVAAVEGCDADDVLQQVGQAWLLVLAADRDRAEDRAAALASRLTMRGAPGDELLAEDLLARLRGTPILARQLSVDLVELAAELEGPEDRPPGVLDLTTGEVLPYFLTDPAEVGDAYVDLDEDPDRWLDLPRMGSRDGWRDMAAFAAGVRSRDVQQRLERAIEGRGAFRRFRDAVHEEGLVDAWRRFSDDRAMGRARQFLADHEVRVVSSPGVSTAGDQLV